MAINLKLMRLSVVQRTPKWYPYEESTLVALKYYTSNCEQSLHVFAGYMVFDIHYAMQPYNN